LAFVGAAAPAWAAGTQRVSVGLRGAEADGQSFNPVNRTRYG
jgi:hypothetical protein